MIVIVLFSRAHLTIWRLLWQTKYGMSISITQQKTSHVLFTLEKAFEDVLEALVGIDITSLCQKP